jgi:hypothetical protein
MLAALPKSVADRTLALAAAWGSPLRWLAARPGDVLVVRRSDAGADETSPVELARSLQAWRRRVRARRLPAVTVRALIVAIAMAVAATLAQRVWDLPVPLVVALSIATFAVAGIWSLTRPVGLLEVARLLDSQLGFDEQIATAVALDRRPPSNQGLRGLLAQRAAGLASPRAGDSIAGAGWRSEAWPAAVVAALLAIVILVPGRSSASKLPSVAAPGVVAPQSAGPAPQGNAAPSLHLRASTTPTTPAKATTTPSQSAPALHSTKGTTTGQAVRPNAEAAMPWLHQHVPSDAGTTKGRATTPQSGLKAGSGHGAETGQAAKTETSKNGKDHAPIGSISAAGQDHNGTPAIGAATQESTAAAKKVPKGGVQSPYGGAASKLAQQHPGLVVGKNVGGTGGFGNGSAGTGKAGKAGQAAGSQTTGAKTGFQLTGAQGQRNAPGVRAAAPNAKSGTRNATSEQGAGVTTYVPPDGAAVPAEDRGLVRAAHPLPATATHRTP